MIGKWREAVAQAVPDADDTANAYASDVIGNKEDAAAAGDPSTTESLVAYLKQVVSELSGTAGIPTWPAGAAPGNGVSLAEGLRKAAEDIANAWTLVTYWSLVQVSLTITNSAQDLALPDIPVTGIPSGVTVKRAILMFKFGIAQDTSGSVNKLDDNAGANTPAIQIRTDTPSAYTDGITIVDNTLNLAALGRRGGDVWIGTIDLSSLVTGNDIYNTLFDDAKADGSNLLLYDIQVGLAVWYGP